MTERSIRVSDPNRQWALDRVARSKEFAKPCDCWKPECVQCAYELGRRVGHVEAGAYYTHDEAFAYLDSSVFGETGK